MNKAVLVCVTLLASSALAAGDDRAEWSRLNAVARPLYESGDPDQALEASRRSLDFALAHEKTLEPGDVATSWHNFGQVNRKAGKIAEARAAYEKALPLYEKSHGASSLAAAIVLNSLALLEYRAKNYASAEQYAQRALGIARAGPPSNERVSEFSNTLAWIYFDQQRYAEAAALYETALAGLSSTSDANDSRLVMLRQQVALAKAGAKPTGVAELAAMSGAADAQTTFIEKVATLARQRKEDELLACFDEQIRSADEAFLRKFLDETVYKFFAASIAVAPYEKVTGASAADGRKGLWHYGFVEDKKHKLHPFQIAIIETSAGPRVLHIATGACVPDRHPRVGPCK